MGFRTEIRAATMELLEDFKAATTGSRLQIYPGRPRSLYPPTAYIEAINEPTISYFAGPRTRTPAVGIMLIQADFDTQDAVTQQDDLVDEFIDWVTVNKHQAGGGTLVTITEVVDLPNFQPDWIPDAPFYFASRLTLDGLKREAGLV